MPDLRRAGIMRRLLSAIIVVAVISASGVYLLAHSHALAPALATPAVTTASPGLLQPYSLGTAPYQYIAYNGSLNETRAATGISKYIAAFMVSSPAACTPSWGGVTSGGLDSQRSAAIAADFNALRTNGGDVVLSFGGASGTDLAVSCQTTAQLQAAYQSVINRYNVTKLDFDIEGQTQTNAAANARRAAALVGLESANPGLKIWVTLPVQSMGLTPMSSAAIRQLRDAGVNLSGINIMTMDYGMAHIDMSQQAIQTATASFEQLRTLYPNSSGAQIWKSLGMTVMIGRNDTTTETFTLADARAVETFAVDKAIGLLSMWAVSRDVQCPAGSTTQQPTITCSGVAQKPYDFLHALTVPTGS